MRRIVEQLRDNPLIDDIVIWNNDPAQQLSFEDPRVTVIDSERNRVTYGRFLAAQHAKHAIIYTQDDDCLVHNIADLHESFRFDPTCIAHGLKLGHLASNAENYFETAQMALVGWGAFFHRDALAAFEPYRGAWGEDELLDRKADRLFSLLMNCRHRSQLAEVTDLAGASGEEALSVRSDHFELTHEAIGRALGLIRQQPDRHAVSETESPSQMPTPPTTPAARVGASAAGAKSRDYFEFARPELLEMIPTSAQQVLDVGCGAGALGESLKQRQTVEVWGIERDAAVAEIADERLDRVLTGDAEQIAAEIAAGSFDCIVCGDVLEHMRQPEEFLKAARRWLKPEGKLIASIPNVRHHSVVSSLLAGNFTYESAGLLDQDHVRFFTRREIEKLFFRTGFDLQQMQIVPGPGYAEWAEAGCPGEVKVGSLQIGGLAPQEAEEFFVYQYLVTAQPVSAAQPNNVGQQTRITVEDRTATKPVVDQSEKIKTLARSVPWPKEKPNVPIPTEHTGWLQDGTRAVLSHGLTSEMQLVVELGAWLGTSTRFMADLAPAATVISIDHWEGSPEHQTRSEWKEMLPTLYEAFLSMCWDARDRIIPLKMTTLAGLRLIAEHGLQPDLIYFDAEHTYEAVRKELELCGQLFPNAILVGDDYEEPGVAQAVQEHAARRGFEVNVEGNNWRGWALQTPQQPPATDSNCIDGGLTSIVIVTHNQLGYTKSCVDSIRQFTDEPFELIFVDNGSTDGTPDYLQSLEDVRVILNPDNRGFPAAVNQGIAVAGGRQILLLNNDILVTTGWLRRMLAALHSDPAIGLVGPTTNNISGEQQIPVSYQDLAELDGFAWDRGKQHNRQYVATDRLVGFCLLIDRPVIETIGTLDERFGIGNFEDDDFCRRAIAAGYHAVIAQDSYIHHFGSRTFAASDLDFAQLLGDNQQLYEQKWQEEQKTPSSLEPAPQTNPPTPHSALRIPHSLSLCMIVRDNADIIEAALTSIRPWVDEMIVIDTGSTDATPRIAEQLGAKVHYFPWCDDFSAARNESLKHATGEWLFWMDSDDTIDATNGQKLRALADGAHEASPLGYVIQVHCPSGSGDGGADTTAVDHVKMFRNRPDLRFECRIHEQILPAIRRAGGEVAFTDIFVVHSGSDQTETGKAGKYVRDFRLLELELADHPDHPFALFNLGMTHADAEQYDEAIDYLKRCLQVSESSESHVRKAYALLVSAYSQSMQHDAAWDACQTGRTHFPDDPELLFRMGLLHHHFERHDEAIAAYQAVLSDRDDRHFSSVDVGITGYKARHNLAIVYEDADRIVDAEIQWRKITEEAPTYRLGWRGLGRVLLMQQKMAAAETLVVQLLNGAAKRHPAIRCEGLLMDAQLGRNQDDTARARRALETARREFPQEIDPLRDLCQLLFEQGVSDDAIAALRELVGRDPDDGAAFHNLGSVLMSRGECSAAIEAYHESLRCRPESSATYAQLGDTLSFVGRHEEAQAAWLSALRLDPHNQVAHCALERLSASRANLSDVQSTDKQDSPARPASKRPQSPAPVGSPEFVLARTARPEIEIEKPSARPLRTAIVVICHNYGRFLGTCLESALAQTWPAADVLVIDDASSDETPDVARAFADRGVRYLRVDCRHVHGARKAGFAGTTADVLCFLDADDELPPEYLESGLAMFTEPNTAVVYSDMQQFGEDSQLVTYPDEYDPSALQRANFIHAGSLVRREALMLSGVFERSFDPNRTHGDWFLWRKVLRNDWNACKQEAVYRYRLHETNWTTHMQEFSEGYYGHAGLETEEITLFVALSGRGDLWPGLSDYLKRQTWPHDQIRLVLLDTSQNELFATEIRNWLSECDYQNTRYMSAAVSRPGLADENRRDPAIQEEVRVAVARIYNCLAREVTTDYAWVLEDDILPPLDACERLLRGFDENTATVSAVYDSRFSGQPCVWDRHINHYPRRDSGLQTVHGNGFGCVVIRGGLLRETVFTATGDYDRTFYQRLNERDLTAKVDWSCTAQHLEVGDVRTEKG